jgi:phosphoglycolate phosphatase-like HAD superfamily hydrolase
LTQQSQPVAVFDFDGTLSLIRTGWQQIMVPMMVEILLQTHSGERAEQLRTVVEESVWRLTGRETIFQMDALVDQIRERGGKPLTALEYKTEYLRRLHETIAANLKGLKDGSIGPDTLLVPGSRAFLEGLQQRGVRMYLASGTDHENVYEEACLLQVDRYFGERIYGARDDHSFSKAMLVRRILADAECTPDLLFGFGDGYVEIEEVKKAGGVAVGVATLEPECVQIDEWKKNRMLGVGADRIVANYLDPEPLLGLVAASRNSNGAKSFR